MPQKSFSKLDNSTPQHFQKLIERSTDHIVLADADGTITYSNPAIEHVQGYSVDEYIGLQMRDILHPDDLPRAREFLESLLSAPNVTKTAAFRGRHKLGHYVWIEVNAVNLLDDPDIGAIVTNSRDISERKQAEGLVNRYAQRMEILHNIDHDIINAQSVQSLVETALKHIRQLIPCQRAGLGLVDFDSNELVVFATSHNIVYERGKGSRIPLKPGYFEEYGTNTVTVIDDIQLMPEPNATYQQLLKEGMRSSLRALLIVDGRPIGILGLNADTPGFFTDEYQEIAIEVANQLAIAIRQLRLSEELERRAAELEQNNADLLKAEAALSRYAQRMEILHEIDTGIINATSIQVLVEGTLKHLRRIIPCHRIDVMILDEPTDEAFVFAVALNGDTKFSPGARVPIPPNVFEGYNANHIRVFDDIRPFQETQPRAKQLVSEGTLVCPECAAYGAGTSGWDARIICGLTRFFHR